MNTGCGTGMAVWLTGLPASGKTTIAKRLQERLASRGIRAPLLDSDSLRKKLAPQAGYSREGRDLFYAELAELAVLCTLHGVSVIIAATAPLRRYREVARTRIRRFAEVYVACEPDICRRRDPKGLWSRADRGEITDLPGANAPYEPPLDPEVRVESEFLTPEAAAEWIDLRLAELGMLPEPDPKRAVMAPERTSVGTAPGKESGPSPGHLD